MSLPPPVNINYLQFLVIPHDTEYDGRGKVHILRRKKEKKSSTLNVELSTEIGFVGILE